MASARFYDGYSRFDPELGRYETWEESVRRVMDMHRRFYTERGVMTDKLSASIDYAEEAYRDRLILGAQRGLQFGGDQLLKHHMRLYNCTSSYADRPAFFGEAFYILLCGAGTGFSVQRHHVARLPMIRPRTKQPKTHVIADSIEGWATALDVLLSSYLIGGGVHPEYEGRRVYFDDSQIRPKGAPISGGFRAPGPEPLMRSLRNIERLLTSVAEDGVLRPINVYDIVMYASDAVLAGGIRRAATICLFSVDDEEMLNAKTGNWMEENPQRGRSNNSAVIVRKDATREQFSRIMRSVREFGEPGFVFVESTEHCFNPCVEVGMYPVLDEAFEQDGVVYPKGSTGWQGCNLTEGNGSMVDSRDAFLRLCRASAILGTLQAGYTDFKFLSPVSKRIFDREALLGVSITGWMNSPDVLFDGDLLREGARLIKRVNRSIADIIGIRPSARCTVVKPSGNASVLLGTASGIHGDKAPRFIRNMQMNKMSDVARIMAATNPYMVEDSVWSAGNTDWVVSFPIVAPEGSIFNADLTGTRLLERVKLVQQTWIEEGTDVDLCVDPTVRHNVSNTVSVRPDEWEEVERYLFDNRRWFAGVSLLPTTGDKDFPQAPFIEVLDEHGIVERYGRAALFASGLIVDAKTGFRDLWEACSVAIGSEDGPSQELRDTRADWVRRFRKFASTHFAGDLKRTEYCLKDVYLLYKWVKIQTEFVPVSFEDELARMVSATKLIDVDTLAGAACAGGACEI